ncbi:mechanosensitive ion channel family protein [Kangiella koreensis]|uniref:Small-conductance mechanosensitive channel n=1 Tax=Kangiella koreensis (strain DSM 16069 / JCM 12317 / KCTC 12182 / SW-125) TaxID=523791 RepID=C7RB49_KANKD|nr:mechanosensitive ion channel family protein [Kangiella koreensis]ACV26491.1 MscS Mechanosensitive ion channel [Kangiella koreensis DSM 16069]
MAEQSNKPQETDTSSSLAEQTLGNIEAYLPDFIIPLWEKLQTNPWILSIIVLVLGFFVAKGVQWFIRSLIMKIAEKTPGDFDDKLAPLLSKTAFSFIFFLTLIIAIEALDLSESIDTFLKRFVVSILILSLMSKLLKATKLVLNALANSKNRFKFVEERTIPILDISSKILIVGAALYFLILSWGIDPTAWLASAGIIGIAVGFAAKDTLANLFSGFFIVADSPYKLGDYIILDAAERGRVTHVGIRSTRLLTRDDVEITIPNSVIGNAKIVNESGGPWEKTRIRVDVGVSYDSDLEFVHDVLMELVDDRDDIANNPAPRVRYRAFGASSIDLQLMAWINYPEQKGMITHKLIMDIHKTFREKGIEIPYSKHDLYVKEFPIAKD